jgi:hypothetical protein
MTLGKEACFAECHTKHSAKYLTWGSPLAVSLPSVPGDTRQRSYLAECQPDSTRQRNLLCRVSPGTLGKDSVSVTRRRNGCFSLPSALWHLANHFAECPRKSTRQRRLCRCTVCRALFAECDIRESLCRVFLRLCRVLQALDKVGDSGSCYILITLIIGNDSILNHV